MNEFDFGFLSSLIDDPLITDINYNGRHPLGRSFAERTLYDRFFTRSRVL
jgi:hypothetical protein